MKDYFSISISDTVALHQSSNLEGLVIKSTGKWCDVLGSDQEMVACQIKGKFRMQGIKTTNPLSVGDRVEFEVQEDGTGVINVIHERRNYIIRKSVNLSKQAHIVAANVDRAFLIVTLASPPTSTGFIDRFLVTADAYSIPVTIVFNKVDIYNEGENDDMEWMENMYQFCGYDTLRLSALEGDGLKEVQAAMSDKINMVGGHSGVGKSTLVNRLIPGAEIKTSTVSDFHKKGRHTTTFAEMHALPFGGWLIDTPGIKGLGLVDIPKNELHHHFPEIFRLLPDCKFHNCLHLTEPGCAVRKAAEATEMPPERYRSYLNMYNEDEGPYRV